jgi:hypothetical protein
MEGFKVNESPEDRHSRQSKGGKARAENLDPVRRKEIAKQAAERRWSSVPQDAHIHRAICGGPEKPLRIGGAEIPAYVLEDQRRVLSLGGMVRSLDMSIGGGGRGQGDRLTKFLRGPRIKPFASSTLLSRMETPVRFRAPTGGSIATGYEATILADICDAVLAARHAKSLRKDQLHIADQCQVLVQAFARIGIIALVDEATGYQEFRAKDDLQKILAAYISKELLPWAERFPLEYYKEMFRLWSWQWPPKDTGRGGPLGPRYAGKLTNILVYDRLPPGVANTLREKSPPDENWQRKDRLHQMLSADIGQPHLEKQVAVVTNLMKFCDDKEEFTTKFERTFPGTFKKARQASFMRKLIGKEDE